MRRYRLPPLLRHVWTELTRPPAMLGRTAAPSDRASDGEARGRSPGATWRSPFAPMIHTVRDLWESPTDEPDGSHAPPGSAAQAERVSQSYFRLRRHSRRTAKKPRPRMKRITRMKRARHVRRSGHRKRSGRRTRHHGARAPAVSGARKTVPGAGATDRRAPARDHLAAALGRHIVTIEPVDTVWKIVPDTGPSYALKATALAPEHIRWLTDAMEDLHRRGFTNPARIVRTTTGDSVVSDGARLYYATEWLAGRRTDFGSTREIGAAARALARLNELSRDLPGLSRQSCAAFALSDTLEARLQEIHRHASLASERTGDEDSFHPLFAAQAPVQLASAERALRLVRSPAVDAHLVTEAMRPGLCHLDVTRRNLLWDGERVRIIDFDLMAPAPRVLDLAHLIRRAMQAHGSWSGELAVAPLVAYNRIRTLDRGDYLLLEALLRFPHRFWRLGRARYEPAEGEGKHTGTQALAELTAAVAQEEERQAFLESFARQVTRRKSE